MKNVTTGTATNVDRITATLNGSLDPDGLGTKYYFEWGTSKRYGHTSAVPPGANLGTSEPGMTAVSVDISGLQTETKYHYRLVASNSEFGVTYGGDQVFETLPAVVGIETRPATDLVPTAATLHGGLNPDGLDTTYYFEWGKTKFYGHTRPAPPGTAVGTTSSESVALSTGLTELEPDTTYHFRMVGVNEFGVSVGEDETFTTPAPPAIEGVFSSDVTADSVRLRARINPNGYETKYRFEYGTSASLALSSPARTERCRRPIPGSRSQSTWTTWMASSTTSG